MKTLGKYKDYYAKQAQKVSERLEKGDFSAYDVKDKEGKVVKAGSEGRMRKNIRATLMLCFQKLKMLKKSKALG